MFAGRFYGIKWPFSINVLIFNKTGLVPIHFNNIEYLQGNTGVLLRNVKYGEAFEKLFLIT
jgi:hypothetical protein